MILAFLSLSFSPHRNEAVLWRAVPSVAQSPEILAQSHCLAGLPGAASGRPELLAPRTKPLCGETDGAWEPPPWGAGLCVPPLHSIPWEKKLSEVQGGNPVCRTT